MSDSQPLTEPGPSTADSTPRAYGKSQPLHAELSHPQLAASYQVIPEGLLPLTDVKGCSSMQASRARYQVLVELAAPDGMVEAALVAVLQDEPGLQQLWPGVLCSFLYLGSRAPMHPGSNGNIR